MRRVQRGEKGFTLIELLIVIAILGVLAAIIIPNVIGLLGRGGEEAQDTEFQSIKTAVAAMMTANDLTSIPNPVSSATATNDMTAFPDTTSDSTNGGKVKDPDGNAYDFDGTGTDDKKGYLLYGHDITADSSATTGLVNYVGSATSAYYYTIDSAGNVTQYDDAAKTTQLNP